MYRPYRRKILWWRIDIKIKRRPERLKIYKGE
jgi:hypothetical protein